MSREIQTVAVVGEPSRTAPVVAGLQATGAQVLAVDATASIREVLAEMPAPAEFADLVVVVGPERGDDLHELLRTVDEAIASFGGDGPGPVAPLIALTSTAFGLSGLAFAMDEPSRVVGLRLAPSPAEHPGAEVTGTVATDPEALDVVAAWLEKGGKTVTRVGDRPGGVVTGLLMPYLNQAAGMYAARYASRDDIDAAMKLGCGLPAGPLQLIDLIGVGVVHDVLDAMHERTGDARHAPSPVLAHLAHAGHTGVAAGRGFYTYAGPGMTEPVADADSAATTPAAPPRPVSTVGVVGSGTMASGIVEVFARSGFDVIVVARAQEKVDAAVAAVTRSLDKAVSRGKLEVSQRDAALARITGATSHAALAGVDLVVEAVVEDLAVKKALFASLDQVCRPGAVIATTTSSLPVVELAAVTSRPADVIGVHFFNPAAVMKLVEVVGTVQTAPDVVATVLDVCERIGKRAVQCGDRAGFVVNALLFPYLNDAVGMVAGNYADLDTVDTAVTAALGYPMGPFALIDVVGVDVTLAIQRTLHREFREPGFAPQPLLEHLDGAGYLGRKTKRGFRTY